MPQSRADSPLSPSPRQLLPRQPAHQARGPGAAPLPALHRPVLAGLPAARGGEHLKRAQHHGPELDSNKPRAPCRLEGRSVCLAVCRGEMGHPWAVWSLWSVVPRGAVVVLLVTTMLGLVAGCGVPSAGPGSGEAVAAQICSASHPRASSHCGRGTAPAAGSQEPPGSGLQPPRIRPAAL